MILINKFNDFTMSKLPCFSEIDKIRSATIKNYNTISD